MLLRDELSSLVRTFFILKFRTDLTLRIYRALEFAVDNRQWTKHDSKLDARVIECHLHAVLTLWS